MPSSPPRPHVMVFDSSRAILSLMDELLTEERYRVTVSTFLPDAFDQIAAQQPALLIIDLVFADDVGWDLLERLAHEALTQRIPVLLTSTDQRLLDRAERNQARYGGEGWIVKPFEIEAILAAARELIAPDERLTA